eukprot:TRINITY_DN10409_c0_g1_i1.p1 TRINITY_DN10409_c0_g1~~TRINITY_DN10409_c0_g1_i1.p1  ORF type:complete len:1069 (+),score=281.83 TRINITY_DN10409_c0_g1_i1:433-3639(+)
MLGVGCDAGSARFRIAVHESGVGAAWVGRGHYGPKGVVAAVPATVALTDHLEVGTAAALREVYTRHDNVLQYATAELLQPQRWLCHPRCRAVEPCSPAGAAALLLEEGLREAASRGVRLVVKQVRHVLPDVACAFAVPIALSSEERAVLAEVPRACGIASPLFVPSVAAIAAHWAQVSSFWVDSDPPRGGWASGSPRSPPARMTRPLSPLPRSPSVMDSSVSGIPSPRPLPGRVSRRRRVRRSVSTIVSSCSSSSHVSTRVGPDSRTLLCIDAGSCFTSVACVRLSRSAKTIEVLSQRGLRVGCRGVLEEAAAALDVPQPEAYSALCDASSAAASEAAVRLAENVAEAVREVVAGCREASPTAVLLVGGAARLTEVRRSVSAALPRGAAVEKMDFDYSAVHGAAFLAARTGVSVITPERGRWALLEAAGEVPADRADRAEASVSSSRFSASVISIAPRKLPRVERVLHDGYEWRPPSETCAAVFHKPCGQERATVAQLVEARSEEGVCLTIDDATAVTLNSEGRVVTLAPPRPGGDLAGFVESQVKRKQAVAAAGEWMSTLEDLVRRAREEFDDAAAAELQQLHPRGADTLNRAQELLRQSEADAAPLLQVAELAAIAELLEVLLQRACPSSPRSAVSTTEFESKAALLALQAFGSGADLRSSTRPQDPQQGRRVASTDAGSSPRLLPDVRQAVSAPGSSPRPSEPRQAASAAGSSPRPSARLPEPQSVLWETPRDASPPPAEAPSGAPTPRVVGSARGGSGNPSEKSAQQPSRAGTRAEQRSGGPPDRSEPLQVSELQVRPLATTGSRVTSARFEDVAAGEAKPEQVSRRYKMLVAALPLSKLQPRPSPAPVLERFCRTLAHRSRQQVPSMLRTSSVVRTSSAPQQQSLSPPKRRSPSAPLRQPFASPKRCSPPRRASPPKRRMPAVRSTQDPGGAFSRSRTTTAPVPRSTPARRTATTPPLRTTTNTTAVPRTAKQLFDASAVRHPAARTQTARHPAVRHPTPIRRPATGRRAATANHPVPFRRRAAPAAGVSSAFTRSVSTRSMGAGPSSGRHAQPAQRKPPTAR